MAVLTSGMVATVGVFASSKTATLTVERYTVGARQAEGALEGMRDREYAQLALSRAPDRATEQPPGGNRLRDESGIREFRVWDDTWEKVEFDGATEGTIDPAPQPFAVSSGETTITGKVYRYVTLREERCPPPQGVCLTKRLIVAVTVDPVTAERPLSPLRPIWLSSVVTDETQGAPAPSGGGLPVDTPVDEDFYLYDTRCGDDDVRAQEQEGNHETHDTAARVEGSPELSSYCWNDLPLRPDLMGSEPPVDLEVEDPPLYRYSAELTNPSPPPTYDYGLGAIKMLRGGSTCRVSYPNPASPSGVNRSKVHAWASPPLPEDFVLSGRVHLDIFTGTAGAQGGRGAVCMTLISRHEVEGGDAQDTQLDQFVCDRSSWRKGFVPRGEDASAQQGRLMPNRKRCLFNLAETEQVPAGDRLVVALSVLDDSDNDLVFFYDHELYPSRVRIATTTPLGLGG